MPGCPVMALPVVAPSPRTTFTSPPGRPARTASSASMSADHGVISDGLSTTAFPAASAGPSFQPAMETGKFQGVIAPTTPCGSLWTRPSLSDAVGTSSPPSLSANSAKKRICSAVTATSPEMDCPIGRVEATNSSRPSVSASRSIRSAQACSARTLSLGWAPAQPLSFKAFRAASTARSTIAASATGQAPWTDAIGRTADVEHAFGGDEGTADVVAGRQPCGGGIEAERHGRGLSGQVPRGVPER